ncbi:hypothetical protein H4Q26_013314 [Puccinia striiformis f. sp. tritici PST-130]|nr:hypothetical protein H4Q26_013314 [Puccinia striiformis f. sp. tritici PST-130]
MRSETGDQRGEGVFIDQRGWETVNSEPSRTRKQDGEKVKLDPGHTRQHGKRGRWGNLHRCHELSLVDQLMMATIHSQKLWSISTPRIANTDGLVGSREIPLKNKATEPFLSIFLKLKSACLDKFHRSSSSPHSTYPKNSDQMMSIKIARN